MTYIRIKSKMVQAMIDIPENVNQILNIVKAKYNLKDKSEAIAIVVAEYGLQILEPEIRPEYLEKLQKIRKRKYSKIFGSMKEFDEYIESKNA